MVSFLYCISVLCLYFVSFVLQVPTSLCSPECPVGYAKHQDGIHECCFSCEICPEGSYINTTGTLFYVHLRCRDKIEPTWFY